jgi:hypothetical protein
VTLWVEIYRRGLQSDKIVYVKSVVSNGAFNQDHHSASELVTVGAVGLVAWDGESCSGGEFRFPNGSNVNVVVLEEQSELCFFTSYVVCIPSNNT